MRWLAGNTHTLGQTGYDWSARSMGKAVDALHDAMVEIEKDGSLYLNEDFMDGIFVAIYENDDGTLGPLPPLVDAMNYTFEERQTPAVDGSKIISFDVLNAELFYPQRQENKDTTEWVETWQLRLQDAF